MMRSIFAALVLSTFAQGVLAQSVDQKIRNAIELPHVVIRMEFQFVPSRKGDNALDPRTRLTNLQKALQGKPDDAATYVEIGLIYDDPPFEDKKQTTAAYEKAIELFRKQLESHPQDGWIMAQLGRCLALTDRRDEAEKMLRAAVQAAPQDWRTWDKLGDFLKDQAAPSLEDGKPFHYNFNSLADLPEKLGPFLKQPRLAEKIERMRAASIEAHGDFDRAIALAPTCAEAYQDRAGYFCQDQLVLQNVLRTVKGEKPDYSLMMPPAALDDIRKASDLAPDDASSQGNAFCAEAMHLVALAMQSGTDPQFGQPGALGKAPEPSRSRLRLLMERLGKILDGKDPNNAKLAGTLLLQMNAFAGEMEQEEKLATRMLTSNPGDEFAWKALCGSYNSQEKHKELAVALEDRLKREDTPDGRLMLAGINEKLGNPALAAEQVLAARKRFPDDLLLNLAEVDLLLRRSDAEAQKRADEAMVQAQALYAKMSDAEKTAKRTNMNLTRSAYLALHGKVEVAKQVLHSILVEDADNEDAKSLLEAMGETP